MSPRLFNLFIMDIISIFGPDCDPPFLQGIAISVLLFADDLALMATTLTVNMDKTKILAVRNKRKDKDPLPPLRYQNATLEWVTGFNYLGVFVDDTGRKQTERAPILQKAHRAQFKLSQMGRSLSFDTKMWLHQTMVDPILLHGAEVWGLKERHEAITRHGIYQGLNEGA